MDLSLVKYDQQNWSITGKGGQDVEEFPSLCGKFLIAMPGMGDSRFESSVVFVCAHSEEGAMGFIVNQPMETPSIQDFLRQLDVISEEELINVPASLVHQHMHVGGPVEPGRGFVLHTPEFASSTTLDVNSRVSLTATLEILRAMATGKGPQKSVLALGYSGWASGQLENEISANGWLICDSDESILFDAANDTKYSRAMSLLGIDAAMLSRDSGHA